ncbi:MAG: hypothetical protein HKN16_02895 [Saprospiraceae bacterium]|nr:hypothetical protein [Saprospiraceae bacterium]
MKILRTLLFVLLGLIVLFFLMGLLKPFVSYGTEITVEKPIQEAWEVVQDPDNFQYWLEGFKSMELIEGESEKVGAKHRVIVNPGDGQEDFEMIETLTSIKEFDHVEMEFESEMMDFYQKINFSEADGKTTISTDSRVEGKGIMMRSMFTMMEMLGGSFTAQETKNFEALKKLIEANTKDYNPAPVVEEAETVSESMEK